MDEPRYPSRQCLYRGCTNTADFDLYKCLCGDHLDKASLVEQTGCVIEWKRQAFAQTDQNAFRQQVERGVLDTFSLGHGHEDFLPKGVFVDVHHIVFPDGKRYVIKLEEVHFSSMSEDKGQEEGFQLSVGQRLREASRKRRAELSPVPGIMEQILTRSFKEAETTGKRECRFKLEDQRIADCEKEILEEAARLEIKVEFEVRGTHVYECVVSW